MVADVVSFTCLKALAYDQRGENKDAYDLIYCLEFANATLDETVDRFNHALGGKHRDIGLALNILRARFATEGRTEGYLKDGPVAVAVFELGDNRSPDVRERRVLRQRDVSGLIERFLAAIL